MPNHCHNRVTFYSANTHDVAKLKQIFEDENCFGQIIPEPDWANTPLMSKDVQGLVMTEVRLASYLLMVDFSLQTDRTTDGTTGVYRTGIPSGTAMM